MISPLLLCIFLFFFNEPIAVLFKKFLVNSKIKEKIYIKVLRVRVKFSKYSEGIRVNNRTLVLLSGAEENQSD